jgi:hypothetical protein
MNAPASDLPKERMQLSQVVSVDDVSGILQIERQVASKLLARWNGQGEKPQRRSARCCGKDRHPEGGRSRSDVAGRLRVRA